jgi:hypothetical protein
MLPITASRAVQVSGLTSNVTHVANGWAEHVRDPAGTVFCWGGGEHGSMSSPGGGSGTPRAVTLTGPGAATALAAGPDSACAVYLGAVRCWGSNTFGQLGDGTTDSSTTPVNVVGLDSGGPGPDRRDGRRHLQHPRVRSPTAGRPTAGAPMA